MGLTLPIGIEGDAYRQATTGATKEGTCEPRDLLALHGDVKLAINELDARSVESGDREVNGALGIVEIGVQVELLLTCGDIKVQRLDAVHTTQTGMGIKSS